MSSQPADGQPADGPVPDALRVEHVSKRYGAVRALTDARFRDRNSDYLRTRFGDSDTYCILTRVPIVNGTTLTPDWTTGENTLFEWPG